MSRPMSIKAVLSVSSVIINCGKHPRRTKVSRKLKGPSSRSNLKKTWKTQLSPDLWCPTNLKNFQNSE
jgi:hypothetical protein